MYIKLENKNIFETEITKDEFKNYIEEIPKEKLIIVGKKIEGITGNYGAVYENFEDDIYNALSKALESLSKYHTLKLIFPENSYFPKEIVKGF